MNRKEETGKGGRGGQKVRKGKGMFSVSLTSEHKIALKGRSKQMILFSYRDGAMSPLSKTLTEGPSGLSQVTKSWVTNAALNSGYTYCIFTLS